MSKLIKDAAQAGLRLHLSKCHIAGNHMSRLNYHLQEESPKKRKMMPVKAEVEEDETEEDFDSDTEVQVPIYMPSVPSIFFTFRPECFYQLIYGIFFSDLGSGRRKK